MKHGKMFGLNKIMKISTEYLMLNATNQIVNTVPNLPPAVKVVAGIASSLGSYEILKQSLDMVPPSMRGIAKGLIEVNSALLVIQQIPNLIAAFGQNF